MAYLYEYGAQAGALVFPELNSERRPYDDEDEGTRGPVEELNEGGRAPLYEPQGWHRPGPLPH